MRIYKAFLFEETLSTLKQNIWNKKFDLASEFYIQGILNIPIWEKKKKKAYLE